MYFSIDNKYTIHGSFGLKAQFITAQRKRSGTLGNDEDDGHRPERAA